MSTCRRAVSFKTYCKRSIRFAMQKLPPEAAKELKRAFEATNADDIYGGELHTYLAVIAQSLECANERIANLKALIKRTKDDLDRI